MISLEANAEDYIKQVNFVLTVAERINITLKIFYN